MSSRGMALGAIPLVTALLLSCTKPAPTVVLELLPSSDVGTLDGFARLELVTSRCDEETPPAPQEFTPSSLNDASPAPAVELPIPPGTPFSLWLQAWAACNEPCKPAGLPAASGCLCIEGGTPGAQELAAEGCTGWLQIEEDTRVPLTLTATTGLCPAPRTRCPAASA